MKRHPVPPLPSIGERIAPGLTVLGIIDGGSDEPVYLVWSHADWCPLACKRMRNWERAEREASVVASMSHPFIVRVLGTLKPQFLLMPFLEGPALAELIDNPAKKLTVSDALRVGCHIGCALQHVHHRGYVHHDVKPENVIVAAGGRPVLFDFGSARKIGSPRPGHITGTDVYISPEECALKDVGPPGDIFAFGVVMYEMLTGDRPFGSPTEAEPLPQRTADLVPLRSRRRSVPKEVEEIVHQCLERGPADRPTLDELLPQLNGLITSGARMWPDGFEP